MRGSGSRQGGADRRVLIVGEQLSVFVEDDEVETPAHDSVGGVAHGPTEAGGVVVSVNRAEKLESVSSVRDESMMGGGDPRVQSVVTDAVQQGRRVQTVLRPQTRHCICANVRVRFIPNGNVGGGEGIEIVHAIEHLRRLSASGNSLEGMVMKSRAHVN